MIAIGIAALMAGASIWTGILRDTAIHITDLFSRELPENLVAESSAVFCILYWSVFVAALVAAVYLAFIDIRFIRLQYALEKQQLFKQSLGDDLARALEGKNGRK